MLDLAIVIVNYNTGELLTRCLHSVYRSRGDFTYAVCVVDNASTDDSFALVRDNFPMSGLIAATENAGYARGNNLGLRHFGFGGAAASSSLDVPRYALLLNPDTELPQDALAEMLAFMVSHPESGIAGPRLELPNGMLDLACRRGFPTPGVSFWRMTGFSRLFPRSRRFGRYNMTFLPPDELAEVDSVVGAFMMVRKEAIQQAGLLDESFFMYGEDLDWAYRIKARGWKVFYYPEVKVLHVKRAASRYSTRAKIEFYRAMRIFYQKHYARSTPFWMHMLVMGGIALQENVVRCQLALTSKADGVIAEAKK